MIKYRTLKLYLANILEGQCHIVCSASNANMHYWYAFGYISLYIIYMYIDQSG